MSSFVQSIITLRKLVQNRVVPETLGRPLQTEIPPEKLYRKPPSILVRYNGKFCELACGCTVYFSV